MNEAISILVGTSVHDRKGPDPNGRDLCVMWIILRRMQSTQQVEAFCNQSTGSPRRFWSASSSAGFMLLFVDAARPCGRNHAS